MSIDKKITIKLELLQDVQVKSSTGGIFVLAAGYYISVDPTILLKVKK